DQRLTERVQMPRRAGTGLEGDTGSGYTGRFGRIDERIDPNRAGKPVGRSLARRLRTASFDLHAMTPVEVDRRTGGRFPRESQLVAELRGRSGRLRAMAQHQESNDNQE